MKTNFINSIKPILADRLMTILLIVFILACIVYSAYVGISLHPSDLQVAVHYTAFGETSFYRDKWYYLITFVIYGLLLGGMHATLAVKIYEQGRRSIALLFLWLSFLVLLIAWLITWSVLRIAFL